ncbi:probable protein phosphatase 2C 33 [Miscanthus floridulus]|uniref:probable protein phosphatase 2C 33 n=1 Tax=Miscanthus floridulus TaxID=154761 RepID=UPI00345801D2
MATAARERRLPPTLPLATLIDRELRAGGSERPTLCYDHAGFAKRGEDNFLVKLDCLRVLRDPASAFSVFAVHTARPPLPLRCCSLSSSLFLLLLRPDLTPLRCLDLARQVFDGHNGVSMAVYNKEHLLEHVMSALPPDIGRDDWLQALPRTLVAGFVKATPLDPLVSETKTGEKAFDVAAVVLLADGDSSGETDGTGVFPQ